MNLLLRLSDKAIAIILLTVKGTAQQPLPQSVSGSSVKLMRVMCIICIVHPYLQWTLLIADCASLNSINSVKENNPFEEFQNLLIEYTFKAGF